MLQGKLVRLRAYQKEDVKKALEYMNDTEITKNLTPRVPYPYTLEDEEKWYSTQTATGDKYDFAIETLEEGKYIGGCGINSVDWKNRNVTVGIYIGDKDYWNKGFGTDALTTLIDFIFEEMNVHKIKLGVYSFNKRAIRCYEKCGFKEEGVLKEDLFKNGQYHDIHLMALLKKDYYN